MKFPPDYYPQKKILWGLLEYKPHWTLTFKGWIILLSLLIIFGIIFIKNIQPFLAIDNPIKADVLVVEGWVGDIVIKGALEEFKQGDYKIIITTGTPLQRGSFLSQYKTYAEMTAATLIALGAPENQVIAIPTPNVAINRTAASAKAVKSWISKSNLEIQGINLYSYDVHTRRSWYLYKRVLEPDIKVGAISYPGDYNPQKWWTTSSGVRAILSETIAYLYGRFFERI